MFEVSEKGENPLEDIDSLPYHAQCRGVYMVFYPLILEQLPSSCYSQAGRLLTLDI